MYCWNETPGRWSKVDLKLNQRLLTMQIFSQLRCLKYEDFDFIIVWVYERLSFFEVVLLHTSAANFCFADLPILITMKFQKKENNLLWHPIQPLKLFFGFCEVLQKLRTDKFSRFEYKQPWQIFICNYVMVIFSELSKGATKIIFKLIKTVFY